MSGEPEARIEISRWRQPPVAEFKKSQAPAGARHVLPPLPGLGPFDIVTGADAPANFDPALSGLTAAPLDRELRLAKAKML